MNVVIEEVSNKLMKRIAQINVENWRKTYKSILPEKVLSQISETQMEEKWEQFLKKGNAKILVATSNGSVAGFIATSIDEELDDTVYIESLHVDQSYRHMGVGTKLLTSVINQSANMDYSICVFTDNKRARDLYIRLGAIHYKYFTDNFYGFSTNSEKLVWYRQK